MRPLVVKKENLSRVEKILDEVQEKSRVRTITEEEVLQACEELKKAYPIPWNALKGSVFTIDLNAQKFSGRYRGHPYSTIFSIKAMNGYFTLIEVSRWHCMESAINCHLSDSAKEAIYNIYNAPEADWNGKTFNLFK